MTAIDSTRMTIPASAGPRGLLVLFLACALMPISFHLGGLLLSPTRILLLASFVPAVALVLAGRAGRVTAVDWLFLAHGAWIILALFITHGTARIPFAGITMIEVTGGYFLGRLVIRDRAQFAWFFRLALFWLILMTPLTFHELLTGTQLVNETLGKYFDTPIRGGSAVGRMGMERVYSVFDHPIHFGIFCATLLSSISFMYWVDGQKGIAALAAVFLIVTAFTSLSAGPLLASVLQVLLLIWNAVMKGQWKLLAVLFVIFYVLLDLVSDRTPVTIMLDTLTFNTGSAWTRIIIFDYGWAAVERNPIFGIGFNDYPKPFWLTSSVDNFWLLVALRYGMVGAGLLIAAYVMHFRLMAKANIGAEDIRGLRTGYLITLLALSLSMVTVHVWGNLSVIIMFFIGAGAWLYTTDLSDVDAPTEVAGTRGRPGRPTVPSQSRYTRFGPGAQPVTRTTRPTGQRGGAVPAGLRKASRGTDGRDLRSTTRPSR